MAYVNAFEKKWDLTQLKFTVVGDVYGGLWSLKEHEAQGFLWEKYTTQPFVDQEKCRRVGEVKTPWPCFVIAVNKQIAQDNSALIKLICETVQQKALALKQNSEAAAIISWRYKLAVDQVKKWLSETDWNYNNALDLSDFERVVHYLKEMKMIQEEEALDWENKLFS